MFGKPGEKAPQVSFQIPKGIDLVCFRSSQHWFSSSVGANNSCALLPDPTVVLFFLRIYQFFYGKGRCVCFPVIKTPQKGGPSFKLPWSGLCTGELEVPHGQEPEDFINRKLKTLRKAIRKQVFGGCLGLLFFFFVFFGLGSWLSMVMVFVYFRLKIRCKVVSQSCPDFKFRACCLVQVEYYFSDLNWAKDEYLRSLADADGFVAIENIMDFKLLKQICSDFDTIKESLETSDLQLSACGNRMRKTNTNQRHWKRQFRMKGRTSFKIYPYFSKLSRLRIMIFYFYCYIALPISSIKW